MYDNGSGAYKSYTDSTSPSVNLSGLAITTGIGTVTSGSSGGNAALGWVATGGILYNQQIVVNTDGTNPFGTGPTQSFHEDFSGGTNGAIISTSNTSFDVVDDWGSNRKGTFTNDSRSPGLAMATWIFTGAYADAQYGKAGGYFEFDAQTQEYFTTYSVKVPDGKYYPGTSSQETYPDVSAIKMSWLFRLGVGDPNYTGDNDLIIPNSVGSSVWFDGNDIGGGSALFSVNTISNWWVWDDWNTISVWVKANAANPTTANGNLYFRVVNSRGMYEASTNSVPVFRNASGSVHNWGSVAIPGYIAGSNQANVQWLVDDVYHSPVANAAARVEIGNNATYSSCTNIATLKIDAWSTSQITATIRSGNINLSNPCWLFITLANNTTRYSVRLI
jgi:hypothetical protein